MKKLILIMGSLILSATVFATSSTQLNNVILQSFQTKSTVKNAQASFPIVYGGQDISKPLIATADESVWSGQQRLVG